MSVPQLLKMPLAYFSQFSASTPTEIGLNCSASAIFWHPCVESTSLILKAPPFILHV
jgi:hypothetical protein